MRSYRTIRASIQGLYTGWKRPGGRALTSFPEYDVQITSGPATLIPAAPAYAVYVNILIGVNLYLIHKQGKRQTIRLLSRSPALMRRRMKQDSQHVQSLP